MVKEQFNREFTNTQLSGFDSIDYRTKVDAQHIIRPETLHSTFDKPASITGQCHILRT